MSKKDSFDFKETVSQDGITKKYIKASKTDWIHKMIHLDGKPFDFTGREYLKFIYNSNFKHKLLCTARQVEKCGLVNDQVQLPDGSVKALQEFVSGDKLVAIDEATGRQTEDTVVASESNSTRPCLKVTTRLGNTFTVTENHPLMTLFAWKRADELKIADKIASLRTLGFFGSAHQPLAFLIGLIFGDGCFSITPSSGAKQFKFSCGNPDLQRSFESHVFSIDGYVPTFTSRKNNTTNGTYNILHRGRIYEWFNNNKLFGMLSHTKVLPAEVFSYDMESTASLIRGLWATDGYCKNLKTGLGLVYCSTSKTLCTQVRQLLRKFGIITTLRTYQPKKGNLAYLIRVVTRRSIQSFYDNIGPIPNKPFTIPLNKENSNLDTLPREIYDFLKRKCIEHGKYLYDYANDGHRFSKCYAPTYQKVKRVQDDIRDKELGAILDNDIIWDEITSIENVGEQETWAIQTRTQTYISENIVQHNSTMLANEIITSSIVVPYFKTLFIAPSHAQVRAFSNQKLRPWIEDSPLIKKYFQNSSVSQQVFERGFTTGSMCFLRSCFLTADRARGLSADLLCLDEVQDILSANIPIIAECLSHSPYFLKIYSGTPKTLDNTIAQYWDQSSQCEWLVPCDRHTPTHWNFIDEKCIGKLGPICNKCGKPIVPANGKWFAFNADREIMSYRIPQPIVPWYAAVPDKWKDLVVKLDTYPKGQFYNEVLGISYDSANKPISRTELMACCTSQLPFRYQPDQWTRNVDVFAGIDWGEGNDGSERNMKGRLKNASYTVLSLGTYINPKQFHIFYFRRFTGNEAQPGELIPELIRVLRAFRVRCIGADWGHGWGMNDRLEEAFGVPRVMKFQHVASQKETRKFDDVGRKIQLARTEVMTDFFLDLKKQLIVFPEWERVKDFLCDYEHIHAEYNESRRMMSYDHKISEPDDAFHSSLYCKEAADSYYGKHK